MTIHPKLIGRSCYHRYEIQPGLYTPGTFMDIEPRRCLDELGVPQNLAGLRVLDIGAWDGAYSFELARRGAEVTALDIQDPDLTVFNAVRELLEAPVGFVQANVYDLNQEAHGRFDMVLFAGVYYHLKSPVLALQRIREVLEDHGRLFIEGASCSVHLAKVMAKDLPGIRLDHLVEVVDRLPLSFFDSEHQIYADESNWWFPTTSCLRVILQDCGFREVQLSLGVSGFNSYGDLRLKGHAQADPDKPRPTEQHNEHGVIASDFSSDRLAELANLDIGLKGFFRHRGF